MAAGRLIQADRPRAGRGLETHSLHGLFWNRNWIGVRGHRGLFAPFLSSEPLGWFSLNFVWDFLQPVVKAAAMGATLATRTWRFWNVAGEKFLERLLFLRIHNNDVSCFLTPAPVGGGWLTPHPGRSTPSKTRYPLYRRLGGSQGRSGRVWKISPPPGLDPRTVRPVASRCIDWADVVHFIWQIWHTQDLYWNRFRGAESVLRSC